MTNKDRHPAAVYLASLAEDVDRGAMRSTLHQVASMLYAPYRRVAT